MGVWKMFERRLEGVQRVFGGYLKDIWKVFTRHLGTGHAESEQAKSGEVKSRHVKSGKVISEQVISGHVES